MRLAEDKRLTITSLQSPRGSPEVRSGVIKSESRERGTHPLSMELQRRENRWADIQSAGVGRQEVGPQVHVPRGHRVDGQRGPYPLEASRLRFDRDYMAAQGSGH